MELRTEQKNNNNMPYALLVLFLVVQLECHCGIRAHIIADSTLGRPGMCTQTVSKGRQSLNRCIDPYPKAPNMEKVPTLGADVCKVALLWATWSPGDRPSAFKFSALYAWWLQLGS